MDIKCLGYKPAWTGKKMWYYKLVIDNLEYLIVDANMIAPLDMLWSEKNEFVNANLSDELEDEIVNEMNSLEKVDNELGDGVEKSFFTQHKIVHVEPIIPKHKGKTYTADEITEILNVLNYFDYIYTDNKFKVITQEMSDYADENCDEVDLLKKLIGYKVKFKTDGDHKNDGQMVEYVFTFVSPDNKKTEIATEMCLMVGWNHCDDEKIR
jgi:hypothetical protein